jgi:hypothetical protein
MSEFQQTVDGVKARTVHLGFGHEHKVLSLLGRSRPREQEAPRHFRSLCLHPRFDFDQPATPVSPLRSKVGRVAARPAAPWQRQPWRLLRVAHDAPRELEEHRNARLQV